MKVVTISAFRKKLKSYLDFVVSSMDAILIPRNSNDSDAVVVISLKEYKLWQKQDIFLMQRLTERGFANPLVNWTQARPGQKVLRIKFSIKFQFTDHAWEEFEHWVENDPSKVDRIKDLFEIHKAVTTQGLGRPEALKHDLKGFWSRRIAGEHRLVYRLSGKKGVEQECSIVQRRYHYFD